MKKTRKEELTQIREEAITKFIGYILAAFGLVAGLAWNEAVKALIEQLFQSPEDSVLAKFVYALAVTAFVLIVTIIVTRLMKKKETNA